MGSFPVGVTATVGTANLTATQRTVVVGDPIALGASHTCALKPDNTVVCWGYNGRGALGNGSLTSQSIPTAVPGLTGVTAISSGGEHTCALKGDRTVVCWGSNASGQLGDNTTLNKNVPTLVTGLFGVVSISAGYDHTCAVTNSAVFCWGLNDKGQLGDGTTVNKSAATLVSGLVTGAPGSPTLVGVSSGYRHTCATKSDGKVACWGQNADGELGDGTRVDKLIPTPVVGLSGVAATHGGARSTCALKTDGTLFCWGDNSSGALGDGTTVTKSLPTQVTGLSDVRSMAGGSSGTHCAVKADASAVCWGVGGSNQLGADTTSNSSVPLPVTGLTGAVFVASGPRHTCTLKADASLVCWGLNDWGQLGDNTLVSRPLQTAVTGGAVFWK